VLLQHEMLSFAICLLELVQSASEFGLVDHEFSRNFYNACEQALYSMNSNDVVGVFPLNIANSFPSINGEQSVHAFGPKQNLYCQCLSERHMDCTIFLEVDSPEYDAVMNLLDNLDPMDDSSPFMKIGVSRPEWAFYMEEMENILAVIRIHRKESRLIKPIARDLCKTGSDGVPACPISLQELNVGDLVYIIRGEGGSDDLNKQPPMAVYCISNTTLFSYFKKSSGGVFMDPLRRRGVEKLSLADYERRIIIDSKPSQAGSSKDHASAAQVESSEQDDGSGTSDLTKQFAKTRISDQRVGSSRIKGLPLKLFFIFSFLTSIFYIIFLTKHKSIESHFVFYVEL